MAVAAQSLRELDGRYVLERHTGPGPPPLGDDWLAAVRAPDGVTVVRRAARGEPEPWAALFSGETAHAPEAPGMLAALLAPLAAAGVPVMVASTFEADVVLVPAARHEAAARALRSAGHVVVLHAAGGTEESPPAR